MNEEMLPHFLIAAPLEEVKKIAQWGTYGKEGKDPLKWVRLIDCSTEHLQAILQTQPHVNQWKDKFVGLRDIIQSILKDRGVIA